MYLKSIVYIKTSYVKYVTPIRDIVVIILHEVYDAKFCHFCFNYYLMNQKKNIALFSC